MKKWLALLLCLSVLPLSGCAYAAQTAAQQDCYDLYFTVRSLDANGGGDAVAAEHSTVSRDDDRDTATLAEALLAQLLAGPADAKLQLPFPSATQLLSLQMKDDRATVDLTSPYATLSGVSLTLADYCITLTLTQLPGIHTVSVTVRGQELAYRDAQSFSADDVLFSSTEDVVGTADATLYFLDANGALVGEDRTLDIYEGETQAETLIGALEKGPENKTLHSSLPEGFTVQSVWMEDDTCYVNLPSSALREIAAAADRQTAIVALARSLRSLAGVISVRILVDGEFTGNYGGVDISRPFGG